MVHTEAVTLCPAGNFWILAWYYQWIFTKMSQKKVLHIYFAMQPENFHDLWLFLGPPPSRLSEFAPSNPTGPFTRSATRYVDYGASISRGGEAPRRVFCEQMRPPKKKCGRGRLEKQFCRTAGAECFRSDEVLSRNCSILLPNLLFSPPTSLRMPGACVVSFHSQSFLFILISFGFLHIIDTICVFTTQRLSRNSKPRS